MTAYIIRRFLWMVPVMLMVTIVTFGAMKLVPGGPFSSGGRPMSPEIRANFERIYHLDEPVWKQYVRYMVGDIVDTGKLRDFGRNGLLGGYLGQAIGLRPTVLLAGAGLASGCLWVFFSPVRGMTSRTVLSEPE